MSCSFSVLGWCASLAGLMVLVSVSKKANVLIIIFTAFEMITRTR